MSHVSDGELHAYLDGALDDFPEERAAAVREHLRTCPDCRRRLEDETVVRREAQELLGGVFPAGVELPSLEELRQLAEVPAATEPTGGELSGAGGGGGGGTAGEPPTGQPGRSIWGSVPKQVIVAWAASLVVALGIGWFGSGSGRAPAASLSDVVSLDAVEEFEEGAEVAAAPVPAGDLAERQAGERSQASATTGTRPQDERQAATRELVMEGMVAGGEVPVVATEVDVAAVGGQVAGRGAPAEQALDPTPAPAAQVANEPAQMALQARVDTGAAAAEARARRAETPAAEGAFAARRRDEAQSRLRAVEPQVASPEEEIPAAPAPKLAEADADARPALTIPGLPVLSVRAVGLASDEIEIVQQLPGGEALELRYRTTSPGDVPDEREALRGFADQAEPPPPAAEDEFRKSDPDVGNVVVVQIGSRTLTARAAIAVDSLRALVERLQAGR